MWSTPKEIVTASDKNVCIKCKRDLRDGQTFIPLDKDKYALVTGKECPFCKRLYVNNPSRVKNILIDNNLSKTFSLDGTYYWNYSAIKEEKQRTISAIKEEKQRNNYLKKLFKKIKTAVMVIQVECKGENIFYTIVNNKADRDETKNVFHYSDIKSRKLLTAYYKEDSSICDFIDGNSIRIVSEFHKDIDFILPKELMIKPGGGMFYGNNYYGKESVDLLLFSPRTKIYEILRSTYDQDCDYYYTDITIFRKWVAMYGNPGVRLVFERRIGYGDWNDLNNQSILKGYGYSVSQEDNLSSKERQELLAEMVDLEIISVPSIVRMLQFFINSHPLDKDYYARTKWVNDLEFIQGYKFNPERFLVAK